MGILTVPLTVGHITIGQMTGISQLQVPYIRVILSALSLWGLKQM